MDLMSVDRGYAGEGSDRVNDRRPERYIHSRAMDATGFGPSPLKPKPQLCPVPGDVILARFPSADRLRRPLSVRGIETHVAGGLRAQGSRLTSLIIRQFEAAAEASKNNPPQDPVSAAFTSTSTFATMQ